MGNLTWVLIIILCVDAVFFLGQVAVTEANPSVNSTVFFDCDNSTLSSYGNCNDLSNIKNPKDALPSGTESVDPTTGGVYTDVFTSILSFIKDVPIIGDLLKLLSGPAQFLGAEGLNLPSSFVWAVGTMWYGLTFFLLISFIWGRQGE